ncbi:hypothetical protein CEXT_430491 [Caerostris extrusa]|uniref:Uncharacterized protein n=1 Tax=Caerostris extrusa TaxID=172846 RepID=A0AAV4XN06_CAEEX|nr:hypothetical protein CEXT_430491 [Caerostris extrusa]
MWLHQQSIRLLMEVKLGLDCQPKPNTKPDRTFRSNAYNPAKERNRNSRKINKTETYAIVLRRHFLGESPFLVSFLGVIHYAEAASGRHQNSPLLASDERERRQNKGGGGAPSFIGVTRGTVDFPKCPMSQAEEGRCGAHSMLGRENKEQPFSGWVLFGKHNAFT